MRIQRCGTGGSTSVRPAPSQTRPSAGRRTLTGFRNMIGREANHQNGLLPGLRIASSLGRKIQRSIKLTLPLIQRSRPGRFASSPVKNVVRQKLMLTTPTTLSRLKFSGFARGATTPGIGNTITASFHTYEQTVLIFAGHGGAGRGWARRGTARRGKAGPGAARIGNHERGGRLTASIFK